MRGEWPFSSKGEGEAEEEVAAEVEQQVDMDQTLRGEGEQTKPVPTGLGRATVSTAGQKTTGQPIALMQSRTNSHNYK